MYCGACPYFPEGVFAPLSSVAVEELKRITHSRFYKEDEFIFREGDPCEGMTLLCRGRVKLFVSAEDGRQRILEIVSPCEILGEPALMDASNHVLTAQALEPAEVHFIDRRDFLAFLSLHGKVAIRMIHNLGEKLRSIRTQVASLAHQDTRSRMAALLLRLNTIFGDPRSERPVIDLPLTREELAEMIGTTQETAIRILSQFRRERLVDLHHRRMVLLDAEALSEMAG